jgi:uncharacterized coiled-coil DUF342 family protein
MLSDDCGQFVDIEDYERLEAERDRLIENISTLLAQRKEAQHKTIETMMEVVTLRARHAELVESAKEILPVTEDSWQRRKLKAALAEVKG